MEITLKSNNGDLRWVIYNSPSEDKRRDINFDTKYSNALAKGWVAVLPNEIVVEGKLKGIVTNNNRIEKKDKNITYILCKKVIKEEVASKKVKKDKATVKESLVVQRKTKK